MGICYEYDEVTDDAETNTELGRRADRERVGERRVGARGAAAAAAAASR